jgi:hypothetical protein
VSITLDTAKNREFIQTRSLQTSFALKTKCKWRTQQRKPKTILLTNSMTQNIRNKITNSTSGNWADINKNRDLRLSDAKNWNLRTNDAKNWHLRKSDAPEVGDRLLGWMIRRRRWIRRGKRWTETCPPGSSTRTESSKYKNYFHNEYLKYQTVNKFD